MPLWPRVPGPKPGFQHFEAVRRLRRSAQRTRTEEPAPTTTRPSTMTAPSAACKSRRRQRSRPQSGQRSAGGKHRSSEQQRTKPPGGSYATARAGFVVLLRADGLRGVWGGSPTVAPGGAIAAVGGVARAQARAVSDRTPILLYLILGHYSVTCD